MPSPDQTLEVQIQLGVTGQQEVKAANDLLKDATATTTASGEATKALGQKTGEAAQNLQLINTQSDTFNQTVNELNQITPLLGLGLKAVLNPENAGPLGIVVAAQLLVSYFKAVREETKNIDAEILRVDTTLRNIGQIENPVTKVDGDAIAKAAENTERLAEAEKNAQTYADQLKSSLASELIEINATSEANARELKTREEKEIAESRLAGTRSGRSPGQQRIEEEGIHSRFQNMDEFGSAVVEQQRIEKMENVLRERKKDQAPLEEAATSANIRLTQGGRSSADAKSNLAGEQSNLEELTAEKNALGPDGSADPGKWKQLNDDINTRQKGIDGLIKEIARRATEETKADADYQNAQAALIENIKATATLEKEIADAKTVQRIHAQSSDTISSERNATLAADTENARLTTLRELQQHRDAFLKNPKPAPDYSEELKTVAEIVSLINQLQPVDRATHTKELADLKTELAQLKEYVKQNRP